MKSPKGLLSINWAIYDVTFAEKLLTRKTFQVLCGFEILNSKIKGLFSKIPHLYFI